MALTDRNALLICDLEIWIFVTMRDCGNKIYKSCHFDDQKQIKLFVIELPMELFVINVVLKRSKFEIWSF